MNSDSFFVIAHWVDFQKHPSEQYSISPRELLTTADCREDAIEAAREWARDRIRLPQFDQEKWDERVAVREVEHVVPANEETGAPGGTVTFVYATVAGLGDTWRAGDGSTAQAVVLQTKYASMFPEFMYKK